MGKFHFPLLNKLICGPPAIVKIEISDDDYFDKENCLVCLGVAGLRDRHKYLRKYVSRKAASSALAFAQSIP